MLRGCGKFGVEVERLGVHRHRREQQVVRLGDRAARLMLERHPDFEFFEVLSGHL